jgi:hypothetical protein
VEKTAKQWATLTNMGSKMLCLALQELHLKEQMMNIPNVSKVILDGDLEATCQEYFNQEEVSKDNLSKLLFAEMCHQFQVLGQKTGKHLNNTLCCS